MNPYARRKQRTARRALLAVLATALLGALCAPAQAEKRTVCTITVNSPDEKEAMRRHLPASQYEFVELVERGRPDWLESACQKQIKCDVLVVSGHFNGHDFFSDQLEAREYLPVAEMERVSCSNACPGLFSQLKEVYLFGCTSLSPDPANSRSSEIERRLVRAGQSRADAERVAHMLADRYEENNREFMRRVFRNVPAIYGFSNVAPLGPISGQLLSRYFQSGGAAPFGTGRANPRLLGQFSAHAMAMTSGLTDADPRTRYRAEVCRFVDDRLTAAQKLRFIHDVLKRDANEARMFFERIETFFASLHDQDRNDAAFARELEDLAADDAARDRYLAYARGADSAGVRSRMLTVASTIGWLTAEQLRDDQVRMVADLLNGVPMSTADLDVVCRLNPDHQLDAELPRLAEFRGDRVDRAAALACLGSAPDHARMLDALASGSEQDVRMGEIYFRHRPIQDVEELRAVAEGIARARRAPDAQAYALDTLSRQYLSDGATLDELMRYFPVSGSLRVQRAIAGILIRADYRAIASPEAVDMLRDHRVKSPDGPDAIDILIRRMQASYAQGGGTATAYQRTSAKFP